VSIGKLEPLGYGLAVELDVYLPKADPVRRQEVIDLAHKTCPYSNATRGNIEVKVSLVD